MWTGVRGVKTWVAHPPLHSHPWLILGGPGSREGAIPVLCLHLSPLLTVRYILWGGVGGGGAIINLSRLIASYPNAAACLPACLPSCLAAWLASRDDCRVCRVKKGGGGEEREGAKGEREKLEKRAERRDPDVFIALPASFLHPSLHSLPGELREVGRSDLREERGRKPRALTSSRWEFRPLLKAWRLIWKHSGVRGSPSYTSVAQGQGGGRGCQAGFSHLWQVTHACVKDELFFQSVNRDQSHRSYH